MVNLVYNSNWIRKIIIRSSYFLIIVLMDFLYHDTKLCITLKFLDKYLDDEGCLSFNIHCILWIMLLVWSRVLKLVNQMSAYLLISFVMSNNAVPALTHRSGRWVHPMTACFGIIFLCRFQSYNFPRFPIQTSLHLYIVRSTMHDFTHG